MNRYYTQSGLIPASIRPYFQEGTALEIVTFSHKGTPSAFPLMLMAIVLAVFIVGQAQVVPLMTALFGISSCLLQLPLWLLLLCPALLAISELRPEIHTEYREAIPPLNPPGTKEGPMPAWIAQSDPNMPRGWWINQTAPVSPEGARRSAEYAARMLAHQQELRREFGTNKW